MMRRGANAQSIAASPTMVGAITTLIAVVAVFLSYNANTGLPFVPVYRVAVEIPDAARLIANNEVRIGGHRVGVVEAIEPVAQDPSAGGAEGEQAPAQDERSSTVAARITLKLDRSAEPIPQDSIFRVRYLSTFGLKYVELIRGSGDPAPEGFVFDGTDDSSVCKLPGNTDTRPVAQPEGADNGCFQPQAEFDDLGNALDHEARENLRGVLTELGGGLAGRGASVSEAIEASRPLLRDLGPVARVLADRPTRLKRFVRSLERTATALAPVDAQLAQGFANAAVAFEALSRDPGALADSISGAVPLLENGIGRLARMRTLLADTAELARRLRPGARDLVPTLPALNNAIEIGTPVLRRIPAAARELRLDLIELERLVTQPSTGLSLRRLREALDEALPAAVHIAPAQTVCNYWNYTFNFLAEHLSQRSTIGFTQRNVVSQPYAVNDPGPVEIAGVQVNFPSSAKAPITGYSGIPADGLAGGANPEEEGLFKPRELPIAHGPVNAPHGQLTEEYPDCGPGQFGYPIGELLLPEQPTIAPGIAVGDYPGSLGPTTAFFKRDGTRVLRDTRVPSRAPTTWGVKP